ncbi:unnamed protein product [Linum tenue]|uniref:Uncharacterized protein n=1 Tax=Linum tenue TaxID=586396 RepID=A0AAV0J5A4_9ROSI|nr:unnamed protein product [Linum tenue]
MGVVVAGSCGVPLLVLKKKTSPAALPPQRRPCLGYYNHGSCRNLEMGVLVGLGKRGRRLRIGASSLFCNPTDDPIIKEVLKEPVAFLGGMFAGLLRLDLNEEPLKEWVTRTVEASGIKEEADVEGGGEEAYDDQSPQQIMIE